MKSEPGQAGVPLERHQSGSTAPVLTAGIKVHAHWPETRNHTSSGLTWLIRNG